MGIIGEAVRGWIATSGLSTRQVARRSGTSSSTLYRVLNDAVDPSVGTVREIGLACGVELVLGTAPASEPLAAAAARSVLESGYLAPGGIAEWADRLPRLADGDDPISLVKTAASYSSPLDRPGAALFDGKITLGQIASAGQASNAAWAVSGAAGLYLPEHTETAPAVTILWCENQHDVTHLLTDSPLTRTHRPDRASIAAIAGEPELFHGSFVEGIVRYAAPIQIIIDCLSLGGQVADDALAEAQTW